MCDINNAFKRIEAIEDYLWPPKGPNDGSGPFEYINYELEKIKEKQDSAIIKINQIASTMLDIKINSNEIEKLREELLLSLKSIEKLKEELTLMEMRRTNRGRTNSIGGMEKY